MLSPQGFLGFVFVCLFVFKSGNFSQLTIILNPLCRGVQQVHSQTCMGLMVCQDEVTLPTLGTFLLDPSA